MAIWLANKLSTWLLGDNVGSTGPSIPQNACADGGIRSKLFLFGFVQTGPKDKVVDCFNTVATKQWPNIDFTSSIPHRPRKNQENVP